jgi:RNase P subunit RPR2
MRSLICSACRVLVNSMDANCLVIDKHYWVVMTCLGFDKARYSLRAENEETKTTTHATRRRDMIVSHLGFLAEHHA